MAIIIPQENSQPVGTPRIQPAADETTFGGGPGIAGINEQNQKIAQSTNEIATFEKIRADQTAVQGAAAQQADLYNKLISDPKEGLPAYQGINAMDGHDKIMAEFQKNANALSASLQPDQQGAFNKIAIEQGRALDQHAMGYVNSQIEQHDTNTFQAAVKNTTQAASNSYGNPDAVATFKSQIDDIAGARAKRLGLGFDQTQDFLRTYNSQFHETVLSQMVNDPKFQQKAQDYYNANKDEMDNDTKEKVEKWLGDGSVKSQANQYVAEFMKENPKSESGFLDAADKIQDPDVRTMVRQIGSAQYQQNRAAVKNDQDQTFENTLDYVQKSGATDPADIRQVIKPTDWNNMTASQRQSVMKSGEDNATSPKMWLDYSAAVKDGSISSMSRSDIQTKFLQYASLSDQKTILNTWAQGKGDTKNLAPTKTFHEMVDQAAVDAKIVPSPRKADWGDDDLHNWKTFGDLAQQQIEATERATGKKLSPANQQDLINKIVIDHTFTKSTWGGLSSQTNFVPFDQIPEDFVSNARKEYPTATEDQVARSYAVLKGGGRPQDARAVFNEKK